jgi:hypothetical protein
MSVLGHRACLKLRTSGTWCLMTGTLKLEMRVLFRLRYPNEEGG